MTFICFLSSPSMKVSPRVQVFTTPFKQSFKQGANFTECVIQLLMSIVWAQFCLADCICLKFLPFYTENRVLQEVKPVNSTTKEGNHTIQCIKMVKYKQSNKNFIHQQNFVQWFYTITIMFNELGNPAHVWSYVSVWSVQFNSFMV